MAHDSAFSRGNVSAFSLGDLEKAASAVLPYTVFQFTADGGTTPVTDARAGRFLDGLALEGRYLVDVSHCEASTTALGASIALPVIVGPTVPKVAFHVDGEVASAAGAASAATISVSSAASGFDIRETVSAGGGRAWTELIMLADRGRTRSAVECAAAAGCSAICLTLDPPIPAERPPVGALPDARLYDSSSWGWSLYGGADDGIVPVAASIDDLEWLTSITALPVVVTGVLRSEDAALCVERGAAGIVVANHSSRRLDGVISAFEALADVVDAIAGRAEVFLQGRVRRGTDVVKALAIGAQAVLLGRPVLWGLAVAGTAGVARALQILHNEILNALAMIGVPRISDVSRKQLLRVPLHITDRRDRGSYEHSSTSASGDRRRFLW